MALVGSISFQQEEGLPRERLPYNTYFTSMVLCVYDNILGPTILKIWLGKSSEVTEEPSTEKLIMISSYVIKDEACREEKINGIETKFYSLEKFNIISCSYIFRAPLRGGKMSLFAFFVTLPYSELSEFMPRYSLCEDKVHNILKKQIIMKMEERKYEFSKRTLIRDEVNDLMEDFTHKLHGLCQVMISVRYDSLPLHISIEETFLGSDLNEPKVKGFHDFISDCIACHLQMGGHTVVFGCDKEAVVKMLKTLALFLSSKERMTSRTVPSNKSEGKRYIPNLFLQGYLKKPDGSLSFTLDYLWKSNFPSTVIDMDKSKICTNETTVPVYLRRREETTSVSSAEKYARTIDELLPFDKGKEALIIKDYIRHMVILPVPYGAREAYTKQFARLLTMKALAVCKYIDAEIKVPPVQSETVWHVSSSKFQESVPKVNKDILMKDLGLGDSLLDLFIILCFAEKIRPNSYKDVLGDPQKDIEHILIDLEFV